MATHQSQYRNGNKPFLVQWQADYDLAVKIPGRVVDVFARRGRFGGLAIWCQVEAPDGSTLYYSPYLDSSPGDGSHNEDAPRCGCDSCAFDEDADAWLDTMHGATDWGLTNWGKGEDSIPAY
jgi:hypothetical protein